MDIHDITALASRRHSETLQMLTSIQAIDGEGTDLEAELKTVLAQYERLDAMSRDIISREANIVNLQIVQHQKRRNALFEDNA